MRKTINIVFSVIFSFFLLNGCSQDRTRYVAVVGKEKISADEFKERFAKYLTMTSSRDNILLRKNILNNMINEKLIFKDITRQKMDSDETSQERFEEIRLQALLDGYSKRISTDTVSVSEQELWDEFRAYNSKVSARYLYAKTKEEALRLKGQLEQGATFKGLARDVFEDPGLANNGGYLGVFGWGEMEPALEAATFSLPIGKISDPIRLKIGYAIVKIETRINTNPLASEYDYAKSKEQLSRAVTEKKVVRLVKDAVDHISKDLSPTFNEEAVQQVFQNWRYLIDGPAHRVSVEQNGSGLRDISSVWMVRFRRADWTVGDFLEKLEKTSERQRKHVTTVQDVKDVCVGLAAREVLLDRAREADLEDDPGVISQIERVREEYLLKRWAQSVRDTVGQHGWDERLLRKNFEENRSQYAFPPEVNVAEILVRTEREAKTLMKRVKNGGNFAELARKNSIRLWAARQGGELGFGTKANYGILGDKFFSARVGQLIGPERVDPYYGVFTIFARRDGRQETFEEAKERISEELAQAKKYEVFKQAVSELRNRSKITIDDDLLANIVLD